MSPAITRPASSSSSSSTSTPRFQLVKDSSGSFYFVPEGTPVPFGVQSQTGININVDLQSLVTSVDSLMQQMGANQTQIKAASQQIVNSGFGRQSAWHVDTSGKVTATPGLFNAPNNFQGWNPFSVFGDIGQAIQSVTDFLKWVAWIFHPRNLLRGVEFLVGGTLILMGLHAYRSDGAGGVGRLAGRAVEATPAGRVVRRVRGGYRGRGMARSEARFSEENKAFREARSRERERQGTRANKRAARRIRPEDIPF